MINRPLFSILLMCLLAALPATAESNEDDAREQGQKLLKFQYQQIMQGTARPAHYHAFMRYLTAERERYEIAAQNAKDAGKDEKAYQFGEYAKWFGHQESLIKQMLTVESDKVRLAAQQSAESRKTIKNLTGQQKALAASLADIRSNSPKR